MNLQPLIYWIDEREKIRKRKGEGLLPRLSSDPPPQLTADPILATYRFCNVRRKDDRVSQWLLKNVLTAENLHKAGEESFILFTALCRWINWPPTIKAIMDAGLWPRKKINWRKIILLMEQLRARRQKVWTGAYMITARGAKLGQSKSEFIIYDVIRPLGNKRVMQKIKTALKTGNKHTTWTILTDQNNWGSFMAGQVVDDWTWTPLLWISNDRYTWAPQGPGSVRGLNRLLGRPLKHRYKEAEWCFHLQEILRKIIEELGVRYRMLTLHDVQNCLCELDKYLRAKNGEGRPKSIYKPETAY